MTMHPLQSDDQQPSSTWFTAWAGTAAITALAVRSRAITREQACAFLGVAITLQALFVTVFNHRSPVVTVPLTVGASLLLIRGVSKLREAYQTLTINRHNEVIMSPPITTLALRERVSQPSYVPAGISHREKFHDLLASIKNKVTSCWPKTHNITQDLEDQYPLLEKQLEDLTKKIAKLERFISERPHLVTLCQQKWQDFSPHLVKSGPLEESLDESNPVDRTYILERRILDKQRILDNYTYFLKTHPEVQEALLQSLHEEEATHD